VTSKAYESALTTFDATANEYRRQEVLSLVATLLRHDAAVFTRAELLRFARREAITVTELTAAVEYCWLCGWCGYDPQSGMVGGGAMEVFRTDGQEQDQSIEGRLAR
jgi:hypothetical protein